MLTGVHFLLTYACTSECDHCFVYGSPRAKGTFTLEKLQHVFAQLDRVDVKTVYFEGGEPFLFYPLLIAGVHMARQRGLNVGIVTNCYWATSVRDALLCLSPLADLGITDLSVSEDCYHGMEPESLLAVHARTAADELGLPCGTIRLEEAHTERVGGEPGSVSRLQLAGDVMFRGRAVDRLLSDDLPRQPASRFNACPHEKLDCPPRVHLDTYGHVQVCQGISIGNLWEEPLSSIIEGYAPGSHPIVGPLLRGGPYALGRTHGLLADEDDNGGYVDACHLCFVIRRALLPQFSHTLAPKQVYTEPE